MQRAPRTPCATLYSGGPTRRSRQPPGHVSFESCAWGRRCLSFALAEKMPTAPSVHDNHIIAYTVLARERRIVISTEFPGRAPQDLIDVVFDDVLAYDFEHDCFDAIILDIEEVDLAALLKDHAAVFEEGARWGWPCGWEKRKETIGAFANRLKMRAFELSPSYGMSGWVIAARMTMVDKQG